jgi:hypothetical protein
MNFRTKKFTTVVYLQKIIVTGRSELVQNQKWYLVLWTNWTSILSYSQTRMNTSINTYMYLIFWFRDVTHVGCRDGRGDECAGCTVACWYYVCNCSHLNGFPSSNLTHAALLHGLEKMNRTAICETTILLENEQVQENLARYITKIFKVLSNEITSIHKIYLSFSTWQ